MKYQKIKLALVCTIGGHFEQLTNLSDFYDRFEHFWITNRNKQTESHLKAEKRYFIGQAHFKEPWTYLRQVLPVLKIFAKEKPTHVLSTGSGRTAFVPFLVSKVLGIKFIYIDTFSRVSGYSKFGTFLVKMGHQIFSQWNGNQNKKVTYIGPIFKKAGDIKRKNDQNFIFVTVGTRVEPFTRLIEAVDELAKNGKMNEKVIVQAGHTKYASNHIEIFDFCKPETIDELILNARYVVTQESAGIGTKCLKYNTRFIVMPRDYKYCELPTKSDMNEDLHFRLAEMGYTKVVNNAIELENAIIEIEHLKTGFVFNNAKAIMMLNNLMENEI